MNSNRLPIPAAEINQAQMDIEKASAREVTTPAFFDYSVLDAETAEIALKTAITIKARHGHTIRMMLDTGRDLIAVKEKLGHGHFGKWLTAEFSWTERTARNYMQAANVFWDKTEIVSDLPASTIYRLAAPTTSPAIIYDVVANLEAGRPVDHRQVDSQIREARRPTFPELKLRRKRLRRRGKLTPEAEKRMAREQRKHEAEADRRLQEINASADQVAEILTKLTRDDANRLLGLLEQHGVMWELRRREEGAQ